jgi:hypothetical protein
LTALKYAKLNPDNRFNRTAAMTAPEPYRLSTTSGNPPNTDRSRPCVPEPLPSIAYT